MLLHDGNRDRIAGRMLAWIDDLRDEHGRPDDEPRHPWLESGAPWPLLDRNWREIIDYSSAVSQSSASRWRGKTKESRPSIRSLASSNPRLG